MGHTPQELLKSIREEIFDCTQAEMATRLAPGFGGELSASTVNRWEKGSRLAPLGVVVALRRLRPRPAVAERFARLLEELDVALTAEHEAARQRRSERRGGDDALPIDVDAPGPAADAPAPDDAASSPSPVAAPVAPLPALPVTPAVPDVPTPTVLQASPSPSHGGIRRVHPMWFAAAAITALLVVQVALRWAPVRVAIVAAPGEWFTARVGETLEWGAQPMRLVVPAQPLKGQQIPPCEQAAGEVSINGGCWVLTGYVAPCPSKLFEHEGRCYRPVAQDLDEPLSIGTEDGRDRGP